MTRITHQINFLASGKGNRQSSGTSSAPTADGASMYIIYKFIGTALIIEISCLQVAAKIYRSLNFDETATTLKSKKTFWGLILNRRDCDKFMASCFFISKQFSTGSFFESDDLDV